jgi:CDP-diglyceride synthetase
MKQVVEAHPERVADDASDEPAPPAGADKKKRRPDWWHREHPVFFPLAGFFTGMAYIILVPGTYAAVLKGMFGYERAQSLFPFVVLTLVVPIGLLVPHRTRRFGRYMLFGAVATAVVVIGVAVSVLYVLYNRDR